MDLVAGPRRQAWALPAGARARLGSRDRPEVPPILRFIVRILAFAAIVLWTLLMVGAFQALVETGRVLGAIDFDLGMPEVEAALLNLMLLLERVGPVGIVVGWTAGVLAILLVRAILLGLLRLVWRATATWQKPAPRAPPSRPSRDAVVPPPPASARAGPWARTPSPAAAALPPTPLPAAPPPAMTGKRERAAPKPAGDSVVDRGFRILGRGGTVVLQRPRGHIERS